jgi:hypothetical protein
MEMEWLVSQPTNSLKMLQMVKIGLMAMSSRLMVMALTSLRSLTSQG